MHCLLRILLTLALVCSACGNRAQADEGLYGLGDPARHRFVSERLGRGFDLFVRTPAELAEGAKVPVLYVLDGGLWFPLFASYYFGLRFEDQLPDMVIELGSKAGSVSILTGIDAGECQIGISQNDVLFGERNTIGISALPLKQVLTENAHLLCKSGISSIQELRRSGKALAIDKPGSGTNYTWNQMIDLDGNYASIPTLPKGGIDAMQAIQRGEAACVLSVVAPGAQSVNALADMARTLGYKLELASFDDGDFDNAKLVIDGVQKRVYISSETDDEIYAGLDHAWGDPNTIEVGATVVVNKDWWNSLNELQKQTVLSAVSAAVPHLRAELRNR